MTARSDIEHWQINATVYKDRVEEIHYITDPARNIRRRPQTKVWKVEQFLGGGGFGEVCLQISTEDGKARAVKRIRTANANLSLEEYKRELKALLEFSKPKSKEAAVFVDFFGWFKDGSDVFLAMEYVPLGDLETNVTACSGKIPEVEARDVTQQILFGLEIMHAESFAHRDLKPENVLVVHGSPQWWVKLADFGLSKKLTETTAYYTKSGTQSYMAPEILDYLDTDTASTEYTNAVDLWAVGCITYRLVTGKVPFPPGPLFDSGIKRSCFEFIRGLLEPHPEVRPSASQALAHVWVTLGSNTGKRPGCLSQSNQGSSGCSESTASDIGYNTVSHDGLKSYHSPSPSHTDSLYAQNFSQTQCASDANSSTASNHSTVTVKPHTSSGSESLLRQLSTEEEATLPTPKLGILANSSSTKVSSAAPKAMPKSPSFSLDGKAVVLSPDRNLIVSASQNNIAQTIFKNVKQVFKSRETGKVRALHTKGHISKVRSVAFSPDGKMVASASDDDEMIQLWDAATGANLHRLRGHTYWVESVAFSPDGKVVASASRDKTVWLWDTATGAALQILKGHTNNVRSVAFSPDGKVVASASNDGTIRLWDAATGAALHTLKGHTHWVESVAFLPDGKVVASTSRDKTARLWDAATGAALQTLKSNIDWVWSVAFSPDGKVAASASGDMTVRLWDVATGADLQTLKGHTKRVTSVAFSPDASVLASASDDRTVRLWDVAIDQLPLN